MIDELVPPREFTEARFENYQPDTRFQSQAEAHSRLQELFAQKKTKVNSKFIGVYLDGGFGVGKTHLLASVFHAFKGKKLFGSFLAFTSLIGALGFAQALKMLSKFDLICIDEFELDDPGNTMIMSRLLNELSAKGVRFAATSNTPPSALGEGRFAAEDFKREILGISALFEILRIDGEDYRHRPVDGHAPRMTQPELETWCLELEAAALDRFDDLLKHLSTLHPAKFAKLLDGVERLGIVEARELNDQAQALRFVALVDRAYEAQVSMRSSGVPLTDVFSDQMVSGGNSKKYLRAISRLHSLAQ
jgi:cell division protein ZapE